MGADLLHALDIITVLAAMFCAKAFEYFPVLKSFCLFKNQRGIDAGFE
jgi:hypothetical protein